MEDGGWRKERGVRGEFGEEGREELLGAEAEEGDHVMEGEGFEVEGERGGG
jgi:hypothetical protein